MTGSITDFTVEGKRRPKITVVVDGEAWVILDAETVVRLNLRRGETLDEARREQILALDEKIRARQAAAGYNARMARTRRELECYLARRRFSPAAAAAAIEDMERLGTLDDARTAERFVRQRRRRPDIGPIRLRAELLARGIAPAEAQRQLDRALDGVDMTAECRAVAEKARPKYEPLSDPKNRRRLTGFLLRRGYGGEVVHNILEAMERE